MAFRIRNLAAAKYPDDKDITESLIVTDPDFADETAKAMFTFDDTPMFLPLELGVY